MKANSLIGMTFGMVKVVQTRLDGGVYVSVENNLLLEVLF